MGKNLSGLPPGRLGLESHDGQELTFNRIGPAHPRVIRPPWARIGNDGLPVCQTTGIIRADDDGWPVEECLIQRYEISSLLPVAKCLFQPCQARSTLQGKAATSQADQGRQVRRAAKPLSQVMGQ
jgi:hypothetical protein